MKTTEYLMSLDLEPKAYDNSISIYGPMENEHVHRVTCLSKNIGSFRLLPYSTGEVYFYDFKIYKRYRGQGYGHKVFPCILNYLYENGYTKIRLQVSSSNPKALSLYKHFDFEIIEQLDLD